MIICDVFSLLILTYLLFSQIGKLFLTTPHLSMNLHLSTNDHHLNSLHCTAIDHHVQPWSPQVCLRGSLRLINGISHQTQSYPQVASSIRSLRSTQQEQCPIMHFLLILSLLLCTHCGFKLTAPTFNDFSIAPIIPTDHYFLHVYNPKTISHGRGHHGSQEGTHFIRVENGMMTTIGSPAVWITQESSSQLKFGWDLVIDPNPQDMLSWLDWVGSLMQLWWGLLSEFIQWS